MTVDPGSEPESHWWETSAIPPLHNSSSPNLRNFQIVAWIWMGNSLFPETCNGHLVLNRWNLYCDYNVSSKLVNLFNVPFGFLKQLKSLGLPFCFFICSILYLFTSLFRYLLISSFLYFWFLRCFFVFLFTFFYSFVIRGKQIQWQFIFYMACNTKTKQHRQIWCSGGFRLLRCSGAFLGVPVFRCSGVFQCSGVPDFSTCRLGHLSWGTKVIFQHFGMDGINACSFPTFQRFDGTPDFCFSLGTDSDM